MQDIKAYELRRRKRSGGQGHETDGGTGREASGNAMCLRFAEREAPFTLGPDPPLLGCLRMPDARVMTPLLLCYQQVICEMSLDMGVPHPLTPFFA